jgi:hypothetical protein
MQLARGTVPSEDDLRCFGHNGASFLARYAQGRSYLGDFHANT